LFVCSFVRLFICFCEIESNTFLVFVLALTFADLAWLGLTMQCLTDDDGIVECQTVEVDDEGGENGDDGGAGAKSKCAAALFCLCLRLRLRLCLCFVFLLPARWTSDDACGQSVQKYTCLTRPLGTTSSRPSARRRSDSTLRRADRSPANYSYGRLLVGGVRGCDGRRRSGGRRFPRRVQGLAHS
jgi:hypothetical protein